tara:strand:+ start:688 stop:1206 length:519 start_codon:yes stop_codon:yes gene_type:complete
MKSTILFLKSFIIFLTILIQEENIKIEFHDYFVSTSDVEYISEKNIIQITIRMFTDDIEDVIAKNNNFKLDPDSDPIEINKKLNQYIIEKFKVIVNKDLMIIDFIGKEYKTDVLQMYYEIKLAEKIKSISFENYFLIDDFINQQNIIHFKKDKFRKSFLLNANNPKGDIILK